MYLDGAMREEGGSIEKKELSFSIADDQALRGRADGSEVGVIELLTHLVL